MLARSSNRADQFDARRQALDPARALARGWSITRTVDGTLVRSPTQVSDGDEIRTELAEGTITSRVSRP